MSTDRFNGDGDLSLSVSEVDQLHTIAEHIDFGMPSNLDGCHYELRVVDASGDTVASISDESGDARVIL